MLGGRDLVGQAQKEPADSRPFALPLLSRLGSNQRTPQVLVLTHPGTRLQVAEAVQHLTASQLPQVRILPILRRADFRDLRS